MFSWLPRRTRQQRWSWSHFGVVVIASVATIGLLVVVVVHKDAGLPKATDCPADSVVNRVLGTDVTAPSAVSQSDLLGCFYPMGSDGQAVSVSFAVVTSADPCRTRHRLLVSGHEACAVTGTAGTARSGASLVVDVGTLQDQFSTDRTSIPLDRLEALAAKIVDGAPPVLHGGTPSVHISGAVSRA